MMGVKATLKNDLPGPRHKKATWPGALVPSPSQPPPPPDLQPGYTVERRSRQCQQLPRSLGLSQLRPPERCPQVGAGAESTVSRTSWPDTPGQSLGQ